jgi:UDP-N-acetyl-D-mannosaminuronic acid transferase (WecB/TagA/CpsF family)
MIQTHEPLGNHRWRQILGVRFLAGAVQEAVTFGLKGGLVVVPAAPGLVTMPTDSAYRAALVGADFAITDSGFMVLLWRLMTGQRLPRVSGLEYLELLLRQPEIREPGAVLWVMPHARARDRNLDWLRQQGHPTTEADCYLAPTYPPGEVTDTELLAFVHRRRPAHIIVCIGGGTQERLGLYLKRNSDYRPGIHCIGAAIGFLSGDQVRIPGWADHLFLGWLFRCISDPRRYVPRYWGAARLAAVMLRWRDKLPEK